MLTSYDYCLSSAHLLHQQPTIEYHQIYTVKSHFFCRSRLVSKVTEIVFEILIDLIIWSRVSGSQVLTHDARDPSILVDPFDP